METLRRLYVGGISPLVTKAELEDRFGKFGRIDDVDIICRKDVQGNPIKTFAYLNINISDVDLNKCISLLNKTKWKGGILEIEKAKESFLHRLSKERQEAKEEEEGANAPCLQNDIVLSLEKAGVTDFLMKSAVPGTQVPNHKNWVVSKFGRVLPVLHLSGKNQSKTMKYDPSKYCQNIKKIEDTFKLVPVSQLTSQLGGGDDEISRKRRGVFPNLMPPRKKKAVIPPKSGGYYDTDQRIPPLAPIQTAERQSNTKEKHLHLQNSSINRMTDGYDTDEELQYVLQREAATRATVTYAEDCSIEVVDDSSELSSMAHWTKRKATPKTDSTCNGLDDSDNDSVNTDEIISVAKTLQKRCNRFETKAETVKVEFSQVKIQKCKEGSTFSHVTKDECKSADIESESDSETGASENDGSSSYSDEEYKAMTQNCLKLDLTIGDLETLAKEANEFENEDETENNGEYDDDDINSKHSDGVAENPPTSRSEIPTLEKKQNAKQSSAGIKKKMNPENMQRVSESGSQGNGDESDSSSSDFEEHYEPINLNGHRENVKTEALKPKSPVASQCLVNHELKKSAQGKKGDANKNGNLGIENVKTKRGIEPDDIVASILECDVINWQSNKKKNNTPVKPPAFKGLSSVLASAATANSVFGSSAISSVEDAAVTEISNDLKQSSCGSKQTKQAERPEPVRDSKLVFLEAKSKIRSGSSDISEKCIGGLSSTSSSFAKPSISRIDTAKEKTTLEVKQKQDNQKRLVAMGERRKELELQKQIIQGALLKLDSKCSNKSQHVVFDSESDEEASTSEEKSIFAHKKADPSTSKLFNSSEEDSDSDEKEDNQRFDIKAQYEGRSGMKLMQLQSCFGTDDRFKMDSRFLESSSEDEEALEAHHSKVDAQDDLCAEKKKNLGILQSILNINVEPQPARKQTAKGKTFKDLNSLHFDPEKKDHATFETKAGERESKSEKKKKQLEAEKLPDVSKETFHEINMDFREVFGASKTQTTKAAETTWDQEVEPEKETQKSRSSELLSSQSKNTEEPVEFTFSFFGNTTEESTSNSEPYKTKTIKAAKVAWQEDPRFQDSSSEDEEETSLAIENKTRTQPDKSTIRFFFVKDDERLKIGPTMFFRSSNTEQEAEVWEERKDFLLEECRKRHKDAKRKTKAKN